MQSLTYILTFKNHFIFKQFLKQLNLPSLLSSLSGGIVGKNSNPPKPIPANINHSFWQFFNKNTFLKIIFALVNEVLTKENS